MAYTYDDFLSAVNTSGLMGNFSSYDLDLAKRHPDAGMQILGYKQDYGKATTDEQRLLANEAANQVRNSFGSYTGGQYGDEYNYTGQTPVNINSIMDQIGSYGSFNYGQDTPTYNNQYSAQQQQLMNDLLNRKDFSYSKESDPQWGSYKKSYLREGERATSNALTQASAASGGRASSYAVNAATQAGDYYATKLNDVIPQLYQQAYSRYLNEYQMKQSDLSAVNNQQQIDYRQFLDNLSQYNTDRSFAHNNHLSGYDMLNNYLGVLQGQDNTNNARTNYQQELEQQRKQQEIDNAFKLASLTESVPDSLYKLLGIENPSMATSKTKTSASSNDTKTSKLTSSIASFGAGDHSDATIKALLADGYPKEYILGAGYKGNYFSQQTPQIDQQSILALGYGPISNEQLEKLIAAGKVIPVNVNGKLGFKKA